MRNRCKLFFVGLRGLCQGFYVFILRKKKNDMFLVFMVDQEMKYYIDQWKERINC